MPSLDWNTAGTCSSNVSEALPLLEIGLYLLITVRWNPDPGADCSILRQAILPAGLSQGVRAIAAPHMDPRRMQPSGTCKDTLAGLAGTAAEGQSSSRGADLAITALHLPGPHPAAPLHEMDRQRQRALVWHLCRKSGSAHHKHRELERRCCQSSSLPAGLTRPVLLSGRSGFLLPQTAHGCTGIRSHSLTYNLAAARVNMGELTTIVGWVPGSALAPVLGQLSAKGWHSAGWASPGPEREQQMSLSSVQGASSHAQSKVPPWHRGICSSPAQTGLLKHPHSRAGTWC